MKLTFSSVTVTVAVLLAATNNQVAEVTAERGVSLFVDVNEAGLDLLNDLPDASDVWNNNDKPSWTNLKKDDKKKKDKDKKDKDKKDKDKKKKKEEPKKKDKHSIATPATSRRARSSASSTKGRKLSVESESNLPTNSSHSWLDMDGAAATTDTDKPTPISFGHHVQTVDTTIGVASA
ncbi:hypothetical protein IV203_030123 [Nitzschia inconspicua]|uniref:Uncharacterized protein n=1 Tax=Nitzschia inconspicua TaxID=303405 RepID=A0A9K3Q106_9STRA|nr:hypothetical protein IV203_030123 [Nitzschia inconspicua]